MSSHLGCPLPSCPTSATFPSPCCLLEIKGSTRACRCYTVSLRLSHSPAWHVQEQQQLKAEAP